MHAPQCSQRSTSSVPRCVVERHHAACALTQAQCSRSRHGLQYLHGVSMGSTSGAIDLQQVSGAVEARVPFGLVASSTTHGAAEQYRQSNIASAAALDGLVVHLIKRVSARHRS